MSKIPDSKVTEAIYRVSIKGEVPKVVAHDLGISTVTIHKYVRHYEYRPWVEGKDLDRGARG